MPANALDGFIADCLSTDASPSSRARRRSP
jgi:hypothetical protein